MAFVLKIKNGPKANQIVPLKPGMTIGRSAETSLPFDDPKMSSKHIQFKLTAEGWMAIDLGSKNGFRFNGERTKKSLVVSGSYLKVGDTEFEVLQVATPPKTPTQARMQGPPTLKTQVNTIAKGSVVPGKRPEATVIQPKTSVTEMTQPPVELGEDPAPVKIERLEWPEYFAQFIQMSSEKVKSRPKEIAPFSRAVQLSVLKGLQTETVWTLGYGPRDVGPHSVDLVIEDPGAPPICFSVFQKDDDIYFVTDRPDVVLLNNASVKTDTLEDGDLISFASTTIKFSFIE
ncbi:MAG: FHA domain-containing protein [Bdellovibrionota bacterium]